MAQNYVRASSARVNCEHRRFFVANLMGPHAQMNFGLPRTEAVDIAEYISQSGKIDT